jgi:hypothetical protein
LQAELLFREQGSLQSQVLAQAVFKQGKARLLSWLAPSARHCQPSQQNVAEQEFTTEFVFALFEMLRYSYLQDDQQLCAALVSGLQDVEWQFEQHNSFLPGLYKLLAHPVLAVRAQVGSSTPARALLLVLAV